MNEDKAAIKQINSILIIDDDDMFLTLLKTFCAKVAPQASVQLYNPVVNGRPGKDFNWDQYDLLFLDYNLGKGENGLDWLRAYCDREDFPATVMLTAEGNEDLAVEAMRVGAMDYMNKLKLSIERLEHAISNVQKKLARKESRSGSQAPHSNICDKIQFYNKLKNAINNTDQRRRSCLLQIQIDDYEKIHETHGLLVADNFVTHMAQAIGVLGASSGNEICLTRIGDAAVACLVTGQDGGSAGENIARSICNEIESQPYVIDGNKITSTVSIGMVLVQDADSADSLLSKADRYSRQASHDSGNSYSGAEELQHRETTGAEQKSPEPVARDKDKKGAGFVIDLPDAIKHSRIQTYFRPFIALSDSASQFDADFFQLRVNVLSVNNAVVPQSELLGADFKAGNPGMLDLWVVRFALSQLLSQDKMESARKSGLFIRLFEESFADNKLYDWMKNLLAKVKNTHIASTVVFEVSPSVFMRHKKNAMTFINHVRDNWGTGFALYDVINTNVFETCQKMAAFEFLEVPVQQDRSLIASLAECSRQAGSLSILENICSAADLNLAIECQFDYGQGDFIQPPLDKLDVASEVIKL